MSISDVLVLRGRICPFRAPHPRSTADVFWFGSAGGVVYLLSAGPVTRRATAFADWFYTPLIPVADIPLVGAALRGWLSLWGVDSGRLDPRASLADD